MKNILCALLLCCCLFAMGCPLQTREPIKGSPAQVPKWLTGRWTEIKDGKPSQSVYLVEVDPSAAGKLKVISLDASGQPESEGGRPAYLSNVGGQLFLSVYEAGDETSDPGYYHFLVSRDKKSGELALVPLKDLIVESEASGEALAAFISEHPDTDDYLEKKDIRNYRKQ